jgi:hypothetical protein
MNPHHLFRFWVITLWLGATLIRGQDLGIEFPPGGRDLLPAGGLAGSKVMLPKNGEGATAEIQQVADAPWAEFWRVDVKQRPPTPGVCRSPPT